MYPATANALKDMSHDERQVRLLQHILPDLTFFGITLYVPAELSSEETHPTPISIVIWASARTQEECQILKTATLQETR